jgi:hypothetical protein
VPVPVAASPATFQESIRRKEFAQAQLRELEVAERRGELVNAAEVEIFVCGMIEMCKTTLLAIPRELSDRLALEDDPVACEELMANSIRSALVHLSEYQPPGTTEPAA